MKEKEGKGMGKALNLDVVTFVVAYKEFKDLAIKTEFDFCGVTNN